MLKYFHALKGPIIIGALSDATPAMVIVMVMMVVVIPCDVSGVGGKR